MSPFTIYILFILLFDVSGAVSAKLWAVHQHWGFLVSATLCFGMTGFLLARSLRYEGLAITNIIWIALGAVFITGAGYFFFHEKITPLQLCGMGLVLIGLVLINLPSGISGNG